MDFSHKWKKSRHNSPQTAYQKKRALTQTEKDIRIIYHKCECSHALEDECVCVCLFVRGRENLQKYNFFR